MAEARVQTDDPLDPFDPTLLLADLAPAARVWVVRLVLDFCRSAFHLSGHRQFAASCRRLAEPLSPRPAAVTTRIALSDRLSLVAGALPEIGRAQRLNSSH